MTHKIFSRIATGFIAVIAAATCHGANTHDVSKGMKIELALIVAKRCVLAATAFNDPRDREKWKELRPQDTLEFAGITDATRLSTLRRYIVRNRDIGVNSVFGIKLDLPMHYPYLLSNSALANIDKSWTIEKLSQEIRANSGLPILTYDTTAKVVANCRWKASGNRNELPTSQWIYGDLNGNQQTELIKCFQSGVDPGSREDGYLPGVGITDGEGDFYPYNASDIAEDIAAEVKTGTYGSLITTIANNATVDFPPFLTSYIVTVNWIQTQDVRYQTGVCNELSFLLSDCLGITTDEKIPTVGGLTLARLGLADKITVSGVITSTNLKKFKAKEVAHRNSIPQLTLSSIKPTTELREIISQYEKQLEGVK